MKDFCFCGSVALALFLFIFLLPGRAFATHPLITDDAYTQGRGNWQVEYDTEYSMNSDDFPGLEARQEVYQLKSIITYGATRDSDIALTVPYWFLFSAGLGANGISDVSFEYKYRFYEEGHRFLAVKPGFSLPTADSSKGLGAGRPNYWLVLIGTFEPKQDLRFHANAEVLYQPNTQGYIEKTWSLTFATEYRFAEKTEVVGNIGASNDPGTVSLTPIDFVLAGLVYSPARGFDVDGGVKAGFNRPGDNYGLLFGLTKRF